MPRKYIDMAGYPRLDHFRHFLTMKQPFISVTVQVDITDWLPRLRESGCPFFLSFQYAVVRAAHWALLRQSGAGTDRFRISGPGLSGFAAILFWHKRSDFRHSFLIVIV